MVFRDRRDAGRQLAAYLRHYAGRDDVIVLALPRGGVPVGYEVAEALGAPLDVFLVRKLGVPGQEELAMGAIASGGVRVLNAEVVRVLRPSDAVIARVEAKERRELARRELEYRASRLPLDVRVKTVILVDDGFATGSTMRAAVAALRRLGPVRIVVAVPVGAADTCADLANEADEAICVHEPEPFFGVGRWYHNFAQTTDAEVNDLLTRAARRTVMVVVLMGVSGSGKTTIGKLLAEQLGWSFAEGDDYHPVANVEKLRQGIPLTDEDRRPWLAALRQRVDEACAKGEDVVLACSALKHAYQDYLERDAPDCVRYVYLHGSEELIQQRLAARKGHFMNPNLLHSQFETLEPPVDAIRVEVSSAPEVVAIEIRAKLGL